MKRFSVMFADSKIASPPNHWLNHNPPIFMETIMMEQSVEAVEGTDNINTIGMTNLMSIKHAL